MTDQRQRQAASTTYPFQGQRYRLTYPEKNASWLSTTPSKCTLQRNSECRQRMLYTPTPQNSCQSTFMPWDRPDPYQCLNLCKGIDIKAITGCEATNCKYRTRINTNGCLREPSAADYTNAPLNGGCSGGNSCQSQSVLTNPKRNPPPPPQYGEKSSDTYDPILWVYGDAYTY